MSTCCISPEHCTWQYATMEELEQMLWGSSTNNKENGNNSKPTSHTKLVQAIQSQVQILLMLLNQAWPSALPAWQQRYLFINSKICMWELGWTECWVALHIYPCVSLPLLVKEASGLSPGEQGYAKKLKKLLRKYGLTNKVCPSMVCKWMHQLGFCYETRKKGYYVDGHEKPTTVAYQWEFTKRYLEYEW